MRLSDIPLTMSASEMAEQKKRDLMKRRTKRSARPRTPTTSSSSPDGRADRWPIENLNETQGDRRGNVLYLCIGRDPGTAVARNRKFAWIWRTHWLIIYLITLLCVCSIYWLYVMVWWSGQSLVTRFDLDLTRAGTGNS